MAYKVSYYIIIMCICILLEIFLLLLLEEIHTAHSNIHMSSYIQIHIHIQQASNKGKEKLCFFPFHFNRQFFFSILSQF